MKREEMKEILTVREVKNYLSIGQNAAYELVAQELFPTIRVGKSIRIPRDGFLRWIDSHK